MDAHLRARLADQVRRAEIILFTGAGFSGAARNAGGDPIPSVEDLKRILWDCAFPDEDFDPLSSLGDLFDCAVEQAGNNTRRRLDAALRVDRDSLPDGYRVWLSMPWFRIYTLNVDDLVEVAGRKFDLPRAIRSISALAEDEVPGENELACVHLNGRLDEFPNLTFSFRQYAERTAGPDLWYQQFARDYAAHPVVFVGTSLDEPPLWQHVELRGRRRGERRELRPGSVLVVPTLSPPRRAILSGFNVDFVAMGHEEFTTSVLAGLSDEARDGLQLATSRVPSGAGEEALLNVGVLRRRAEGDPRDFLWGSEPTWRDLTDGFAVQRAFEGDLPQQIADGAARVAVFTGTAGSGKSTTLMRLALAYHAEGKDVRWLNPESELSLRGIRDVIKVSGAAVLVVDDADMFGDSTGPLLSEIASDNEDLLVVAAVRSTRYDRLRIATHLRDTPAFQLTIPNLDDADIEQLLDALSRANRLGALTGKPHDEQVEAFRRRAGRQLIVAMIEATSNERFDEKINRECDEIGPDAGAIYAVVALATHLRQHLTTDEVLAAVGGRKLETLNLLQGLVNQHLVSRTAGNQLRLRHRVIADKVVEHCRSQRQLAEPARGLLFAMATGVTRSESRNSRKWRLLVRLLNHDWLISTLDDRPKIRQAYDEIENVMSWDSHYWLQRGSFEVEAGDIELAKTFLETARSLSPFDHKIQTEWAYMTLKRAALNARETFAAESAEEAFGALEDAIERRGRADPYPYHVMGSQGLAWTRQAPLVRDEKLKLLERLRFVVSSGVKCHPDEPSLKQLATDLETEYLLVGAVRPAGSAAESPAED